MILWAKYGKLDPIKYVPKDIKCHWDGILHWKELQVNNGILEGLNSIFQAAKRKTRGYEFIHFKND